MSKPSCAVTQAFEPFREFVETKLCGRCLPCVIAARQVMDTFEDLCQGRVKREDVAFLKMLADSASHAVQCKLGKKAMQTLAEDLGRALDQEYRQAKGDSGEAHAGPGGYRIDPAKCCMCDLCRQVCEAQAVVGEPYVPYLTDNRPYQILIGKCTGCGACVDVCEAGAIEVA